MALYGMATEYPENGSRRYRASHCSPDEPIIFTFTSGRPHLGLVARSHGSILYLRDSLVRSIFLLDTIVSFYLDI